MKITKIYWFLLAFVCLAGLVIAVYNTALYSSNMANPVYKYQIASPHRTVPVKNKPTNNVTGIVRSVDDGSITISTTSPDPLATAEPTSRVIHLTPETKVIAVVAKTPAQIKADLKKFKSDQESGIAVAPPSPMSEIVVPSSDLKLTMVITAFADKDISNAASFDASKISFQTF